MHDSFQVYQTGDGSPTLSFGLDLTAEKMHSQEGAWGEALYIYGGPMRDLIQKQWPSRILSVGLGLGYNEILAACLFTEKPPDSLISAEPVDFLRSEILSYVLGRLQGQRLSAAYESIFSKASAVFGQDKQVLKTRLAQWNEAGIWKCIEDFRVSEDRFNCIFYDLFSRSTNPEYWSFDFLESFLNHCASDLCVFTTYASTRSLKKALGSAGFETVPKKGFGKKRESTYAVKGPC